MEALKYWGVFCFLPTIFIANKYHWPKHENCHWESWAFDCELWWSSRDFQTKKIEDCSLIYIFNNKIILLWVLPFIIIIKNSDFLGGGIRPPSVWSPELNSNILLPSCWLLSFLNLVSLSNSRCLMKWPR